VAGDFFKLSEETLPELALRQRRGGWGKSFWFFVTAVGREGNDEEFNHFRIGVNDPGRLAGVRGGDHQRTPFGEILLANKARLAARVRIERTEHGQQSGPAGLC